MKSIIVRGPVFSASGYGEHTRFILRCLKEYEDLYDIYVHPLNWGHTAWEIPTDEEGQWMKSLADKLAHNPANSFDISIQVTIPNEFEPMARYNVGCTAGIESDKVVGEWVEKCNMMDKMVVVSEHTKQGFLNTVLANGPQEMRVTTPIEVVNYPVKPISTKELELDFSTDFNFLCVALMGPRKNIDNTLKWFIEKFHDNEDVGMVLKTAFTGASELDHMHTTNHINSILGKYPTRKCKVYLLHGRMTEEEMSGLLQNEKIKAMVSLSHGEGFGLPLFEAAYHGLPVIAPGWSGQMDFLMQEEKGKKKKKKYFSNVQCDIKAVQKEAHWKGVIDPESSWCFPKKIAYQQRLEEAYKEHGRLKSRAKKLKAILLEKHDPKVISKQFMDAWGHVEEIDHIPVWREEASSKAPKERATFLAEKCREITSQKDKLRLLKDSFRGDECYILSCGPTLLDNNQKKLKKLISENVCISIKQAYDLFKQETDFHVYNCANFKKYEHDGDRVPLTMEASTTPYKLGQCDLKFFIKEREFDNSLAATDEYEKWTLEKQTVLRPYGPGIMTEAVIYLIEHLGFSTATTVGYDNKLLDADKEKQHFYTKEGSSFNKEEFIQQNDTMSIVSIERLKEEEKISIDAIGKWSSWLKEKGCTLKICSSMNPADESIERIEI